MRKKIHRMATTSFCVFSQIFPVSGRIAKDCFRLFREKKFRKKLQIFRKFGLSGSGFDLKHRTETRDGSDRRRRYPSSQCQRGTELARLQALDYDDSYMRLRLQLDIGQLSIVCQTVKYFLKIAQVFIYCLSQKQCLRHLGYCAP